MPRNGTLPLPRLQTRISALGERLRQARLRRRFSLAIVAERAGVSVETLRRLELGKGSCTLATFVTILFVLGLDADIEAVAKDDELGRKLQDLALPTRIRAPRKSRAVESDHPGHKDRTDGTDDSP